MGQSDDQIILAPAHTSHGASCAFFFFDYTWNAPRETESDLWCCLDVPIEAGERERTKTNEPSRDSITYCCTFQDKPSYAHNYLLMER